MTTERFRQLQLTTNQVRHVVRIDDIPYSLRTANDLTLSMYKTLERISPRIGGLLLLDTLSTEEEQELSRLLDQAARLALDAPEDVQVRLGDMNRINVFRVFAEIVTPSLLPTWVEMTPAQHAAI